MTKTKGGPEMLGRPRQTYQPTRIPLAVAPAPPVPSAKKQQQKTNKVARAGRGALGASAYPFPHLSQGQILM